MNVSDLINPPPRSSCLSPSPPAISPSLMWPNHTLYQQPALACSPGSETRSPICRRTLAFTPLRRQVMSPQRGIGPQHHTDLPFSGSQPGDTHQMLAYQQFNANMQKPGAHHPTEDPVLRELLKNAHNQAQQQQQYIQKLTEERIALVQQLKTQTEEVERQTIVIESQKRAMQHLSTMLSAKSEQLQELHKIMHSYTIPPCTKSLPPTAANLQDEGICNNKTNNVNSYSGQNGNNSTLLGGVGGGDHCSSRRPSTIASSEVAELLKGARGVAAVAADWATASSNPPSSLWESTGFTAPPQQQEEERATPPLLLLTANTTTIDQQDATQTNSKETHTHTTFVHTHHRCITSTAVLDTSLTQQLQPTLSITADVDPTTTHTLHLPTSYEEEDGTNATTRLVGIKLGDPTYTTTSALEGKLQQLERDLMEREAELHRVMKECKRLRKQVQKQSNECADLLGVRQKLVSVEEEVDTMTSVTDTLQKRLYRRDNTIERLHSDLQTLHQQLHEYREREAQEVLLRSHTNALLVERQTLLEEAHCTAQESIQQLEKSSREVLCTLIQDISLPLCKRVHKLTQQITLPRSSKSDSRRSTSGGGSSSRQHQSPLKSSSPYRRTTATPPDRYPLVKSKPTKEVPPPQHQQQQQQGAMKALEQKNEELLLELDKCKSQMVEICEELQQVSEVRDAHKVEVDKLQQHVKELVSQCQRKDVEWSQREAELELDYNKKEAAWVAKELQQWEQQQRSKSPKLPNTEGAVDYSKYKQLHDQVLLLYNMVVQYKEKEIKWNWWEDVQTVWQLQFGTPRTKHAEIQQSQVPPEIETLRDNIAELACDGDIDVDTDGLTKEEHNKNCIMVILMTIMDLHNKRGTEAKGAPPAIKASPSTATNDAEISIELDADPTGHNVSAELQESVEEKQALIEGLSIDNNKYAFMNKDLSEKITALRRSNSQYEEQLQEQEAHITALQIKLEAAHRIADTKAAALKRMETLVNTVEAESDKKQALVNQLTEKIGEKEAAIAELKCDDKLEEEKLKLSQSETKWRKTLAEKQTEITELEQNNHKFLEQQETVMKLLQKQYAESKTMVEESEETVQRLSIEIRKQQGALSQLGEDKNRLQEQITELEESVKSLRADNSKLKAKLMETDLELITTEKNRNQILSLHKSESAERVAELQQLSTQKQENAMLKQKLTELETVQQQNSILQQNVDSALKEVDVVQQQLTAQQQETEQKVVELDDMTKENLALKVELKGGIAKLETIQQQLTVEGQEKAVMSQKLIEMEAALSDSRQTFESLVQRTNGQDAEITTLNGLVELGKADNAQLVAELNACKEETDNVTNENKFLQAEVRELREVIEHHTKEFEYLNNTLIQQEKINDELQATHADLTQQLDLEADNCRIAQRSAESHSMMVAESQQQCDDLQAELAEKQDELHLYVSKQQQGEQQLAECTVVIADYKANLAEIEEQLCTLEERLSEANLRLTDSSEQIMCYKQKLTEVELDFKKEEKKWEMQCAEWKVQETAWTSKQTEWNVKECQFTQKLQQLQTVIEESDNKFCTLQSELIRATGGDRDVPTSLHDILQAEISWKSSIQTLLLATTNEMHNHFNSLFKLHMDKEAAHQQETIREMDGDLHDAKRKIHNLEIEVQLATNKGKLVNNQLELLNKEKEVWLTKEMAWQHERQEWNRRQRAWERQQQEWESDAFKKSSVGDNEALLEKLKKWESKEATWHLEWEKKQQHWGTQEKDWQEERLEANKVAQQLLELQEKHSVIQQDYKQAVVEGERLRDEQHTKEADILQLTEHVASLKSKYEKSTTHSAVQATYDTSTVFTTTDDPPISTTQVQTDITGESVDNRILALQSSVAELQKHNEELKHRKKLLSTRLKATNSALYESTKNILNTIQVGESAEMDFDTLRAAQDLQRHIVELKMESVGNESEDMEDGSGGAHQLSSDEHTAAVAAAAVAPLPAHLFQVYNAAFNEVVELKKKNQKLNELKVVQNKELQNLNDQLYHVLDKMHKLKTENRQLTQKMEYVQRECHVQRNRIYALQNLNTSLILQIDEYKKIDIQKNVAAANTENVTTAVSANIQKQLVEAQKELEAVQKNFSDLTLATSSNTNSLTPNGKSGEQQNDGSDGKQAAHDQQQTENATTQFMEESTQSTTTTHLPTLQEMQAKPGDTKNNQKSTIGGISPMSTTTTTSSSSSSSDGVMREGGGNGGVSSSSSTMQLHSIINELNDDMLKLEKRFSDAVVEWNVERFNYVQQINALEQKLEDNNGLPLTVDGTESLSELETNSTKGTHTPSADGLTLMTTTITTASPVSVQATTQSSNSETCSSSSATVHITEEQFTCMYHNHIEVFLDFSLHTLAINSMLKELLFAVYHLTNGQITIPLQSFEDISRALQEEVSELKARSGHLQEQHNQNTVVARNNRQLWTIEMLQIINAINDCQNTLNTLSTVNTAQREEEAVTQEGQLVELKDTVQYQQNLISNHQSTIAALQHRLTENNIQLQEQESNLNNQSTEIRALQNINNKLHNSIALLEQEKQQTLSELGRLEGTVQALLLNNQLQIINPPSPPPHPPPTSSSSSPPDTPQTVRLQQGLQLFPRGMFGGLERTGGGGGSSRQQQESNSVFTSPLFYNSSSGDDEGIPTSPQRDVFFTDQRGEIVSMGTTGKQYATPIPVLPISGIIMDDIMDGTTPTGQYSPTSTTAAVALSPLQYADNGGSLREDFSWLVEGDLLGTQLRHHSTNDFPPHSTHTNNGFVTVRRNNSNNNNRSSSSLVSPFTPPSQRRDTQRSAFATLNTSNPFQHLSSPLHHTSSDSPTLFDLSDIWHSISVQKARTPPSALFSTATSPTENTILTLSNNDTTSSQSSVIKPKTPQETPSKRKPTPNEKKPGQPGLLGLSSIGSELCDTINESITNIQAAFSNASHL